MIVQLERALEVSVPRQRDEILYTARLTPNEVIELINGNTLTGLIKYQGRLETINLMLDPDGKMIRREENNIYLTKFELDMLERNSNWHARYDYKTHSGITLIKYLGKQ